MEFLAELLGAIIEFFADIWLDHVVDRFRRWRKRKKDKKEKEDEQQAEQQQNN